MRIQEHIYQGFFGLKKKEDAGKYYSMRVDRLRGFDSDLDAVIDAFQHIMDNHNVKLRKYEEFLHDQSISKFQEVLHEVQKLEGIFDPDEVENNKGHRYLVKNIDRLTALSNNEESLELKQLEQENISDLKELLRLFESITPVWQAQIDLEERANPKKIDHETIRKLSEIFKHESAILNMEESLLKKIDLKTGIILRKTSLKNADIQRTSDMDMKYREVRYIR